MSWLSSPYKLLAMSFNPEHYTFSLGEHRGNKVIWIVFPKNQTLIDHLRKFVKAQWSSSQKCWYVIDVAQYRKLFGLPEKSLGKEALSKIATINQSQFKRYHELLTLKAYSPNTQRTYCYEFAQFLYCLGTYPVKKITSAQLKRYCVYCLKELGLSENQVHSRMNALKFYYEQVLNREKSFFDIPRPKKPHLLPNLLSVQEVEKLFKVTKNEKHLLILKLCYGMGLRVSEVVALKMEHIDTDRMQVFIKGAKGKKDRYGVLPKTILPSLQRYCLQYNPHLYLFEGQFGGVFSIRSVQLVFKNAMTKAGIKKSVGIHSLRHSYATHLLEYGTDISLIQRLLGHNNVKTTLIYTHISNRSLSKIKSPLDHMQQAENNA